MTNMKFQLPRLGRRRHGEIPGRQAGEGKRRILARRIVERSPTHDFEAKNSDVMGRGFDHPDAAFQATAGMESGVFGGDGFNLAIGPGHRAAGEDQPARLFILRKGKFRMRRHLHLTRHQVRFAGAAIARPAAMGILHAGAAQGLQNGTAHGIFKRACDSAIGHGGGNFEAHGDTLTQRRSSAIDHFNNGSAGPCPGSGPAIGNGTREC